MYSARTPSISFGYTGGHNQMFVCACAIGRKETETRLAGDIIVSFNESQIIPVFLVTFEDKNKKKVKKEKKVNKYTVQYKQAKKYEKLKKLQELKESESDDTSESYESSDESSEYEEEEDESFLKLSLNK